MNVTYVCVPTFLPAIHHTTCISISNFLLIYFSLLLIFIHLPAVNYSIVHFIIIFLNEFFKIKHAMTTRYTIPFRRDGHILETNVLYATFTVKDFLPVLDVLHYSTSKNHTCKPLSTVPFASGLYLALKSSKNVQFLIYKSFTTKVVLSFRQQDQLRSSMEGGVSRINIPKEQLFADQKGRLTALGDRV